MLHRLLLLSLTHNRQIDMYKKFPPVAGNAPKCAFAHRVASRVKKETNEDTRDEDNLHNQPLRAFEKQLLEKTPCTEVSIRLNREI